MKFRAVILNLVVGLGLASLLSGCLVEMLMSSAVTADMAAQNAGAMADAKSSAQIDTDLVRLQEAVDTFAADKGVYPETLSALVPSHIDAVPVRPDGKSYGYNPIEGEVYESGDGPAPADYILMEKIDAAIVSYGTATGYYPPTLDVLYPKYLPLPPRTASGKAFGYNNKNGELTHPDEGKQYGTAANEGTDGAATSPAKPVKPVNAVGALNQGDVKDSNSLNKALDRMGY